MESFFLSETVKYLFLLFANASAAVDHFVLSTEVGWAGGLGGAVAGALGCVLCALQLCPARQAAAVDHPVLSTEVSGRMSWLLGGGQLGWQ